MRCMVTGGTGFVGSNLALQLAADGHEVIITGHQAEQKLPGFTGKILYPTFQGINWDAIGKLDVLFHQAGITDTLILDRDEMIRVNVQASEELFRKVIANGCKRIVYASSTAAYGNAPAPYFEDSTPLTPLNPYGESKKMLEELVKRLQTEFPQVIFVGLRYCNIYGPREDHKGKMMCIVSQLAKQMVKGNPKMFKHGEQRRDYIYVKDVVRANILASKAKESCVVNCGLGKAISFNELVTVLNDILGTSRVPEYIDNPYAARYQSHTECNMDKAKKLIGFTPIYDIKTGLQDYHASGFLVQ